METPSNRSGDHRSHVPDRAAGTPTWDLGDDGFLRVAGLVSAPAREALVRRLNVEITRQGLDPAQIVEASGSTCFPHLRWHPEVEAVRSEVDVAVRPPEGSTWADAQLLLRFPDEATEWPLEPHVDQEPQWAEGRRYSLIVGVALTRSYEVDGGLVVWPGSHRGADLGTTPVELDDGDVILMHPLLHHCSTLNRSPLIRYAVDFRLLAP